MERKARREIEKAVRDSDAPLTTLIGLVGTEMEAAYARQQSTLDAQSIYRYRAYNDHRSTTDAVSMLALTDRIEAYRQHQQTLHAADPGPAIVAMKKTHTALVEYVNSNKDPRRSANWSNSRRISCPKLNHWGKRFRR